MVVVPVNSESVIAQASISFANACLAYVVVSQIVDRIAQHRFKTMGGKLVLTLAGIAILLLMAKVAKEVVLVAQCVMTVVLRHLPPSQISSQSSLPSFMVDMVQEAKSGGNFCYSGHEKYIRQIEISINRKDRGSAVLVGLPGVGKTAIFETIAWQGAHGEIPATSPLHKKRLIKVDVGTLTANTKYRGELEDKVQQLITIGSNPDVILFVDEIHKIVGVGNTDNAQHSLTISNQLKPVLARSGFTVIGATTFDEYRHIAKDVALQRRFDAIVVNPPTPEECIKMLQTRLANGYYSKLYPRFKIDPKALQAAVFFASTYKFGTLPDAANVLLELTCSQKELEASEEALIVNDVADVMRRKYSQLAGVDLVGLFNQSAYGQSDSPSLQN